MVGGVVTHRQRPATAQGITFINLEDETGLINVVVLEGLLGPLPAGGPGGAGAPRPGPARELEGVINVVAERLEPLPVAASAGSRGLR